jgi:hypothetical protein
MVQFRQAGIARYVLRPRKDENENMYYIRQVTVNTNSISRLDTCNISFDEDSFLAVDKAVVMKMPHVNHSKHPLCFCVVYIEVINANDN